MQFFAADFLTTLLLFVVVLSFIVFIHELGHFLPARYYGIKVDTFSIGFGKEIFGWTDSKGTRWKFSWVPLGGYVKFFGDADASSSSVDKTISEKEKKLSLYYRPLKERIIVSFGGPAANYLLAMILFFSAFFLVGQPGMSTKIESFSEESPAKSAGLVVGDEIRSINDHEVKTFADILNVMGDLKTPEVNVKISRNGTEHYYMLLANTLKIGESERFILGVKTGNGPSFQIWSSVSKSVMYPFQISYSTLLALKNMIVKTNMEGLGGPIAIAKGIKSAAEMGLMVVIFYAALISTSLGFFNLLPIPTLDGGHLLFYFIEAIRGKPVSEKIQEWAFMIGFGTLMVLFLFVTYKDVFFK
ncbi:MAG: RIP metalloprotease RseP [Candidatus Paracaedibacteraceae bacterium]|nr:RIP metalloprotease RseP [Candidatus Paracaedibacteraceae bacterium]